MERNPMGSKADHERQPMFRGCSASNHSTVFGDAEARVQTAPRSVPFKLTLRHRRNHRRRHFATIGLAAAGTMEPPGAGTLMVSS